MTKTYCDRCGKEEDTSGNIDVWGKDYKNIDTFSLCPSCLKALEEFMNTSQLTKAYEQGH